MGMAVGLMGKIVVGWLWEGSREMVEENVDGLCSMAT
jgi:hypothetical protein